MTSPAVVSYIGLGSNLADPVRQVRSALEALARRSDVECDGCSSLYRSAPVGDVSQADFVNAVCRVRTQLSPEELLRALMEIERAHGRRRDGVCGGPRTLDMDLLLFGAERHRSDDLELPHPRMHERAFVLAPLLELDPEISVPGRGRAADLLSACAGQRLERLPD